MSGHTPGPWALGVKGDGAVGSVYCDNSMGSRVAVVYGLEQKFVIFPRQEEEANARLIAAAPELLEALRSAREWHRGDKWRGTEKHDAWQAQADLLDAAIAKAAQP